ncbi:MULTISPECIES: DciA family protein [Streptomyces]|uniref:DciA family protein n=1 Tax=Streptomyces TaxID=1883 RepID=UPI000BF10C4A|nr:DciA family protein [Streptomyces sp. or20]
MGRTGGCGRDDGQRHRARREDRCCPVRDATTRTLYLRPARPACRTQLTLHQKQITAEVNASVGPGAIRQLEILRPAALDSPHHTPTQ